MKGKAKHVVGGGGEESMKYSNNNGGVAWSRGPLLGKGGFGSVYLASLKNPKSRNGYYPPVMAVKSAEVSASCSLQKEKEVFNCLNGCPFIIKCFGEETTRDGGGEMFYNVLLEYASGGTLAGLIKKSDGVGLPELDVKRYTRSILEGIHYIHSHGYVHCDLKPDNILLVSSSTKAGEFVAKIGDFGLAKKSEKRNKKRKFDPYLRGTTLYMAPETVANHVQEPPCDIWALGCVVLEMLTGKQAWDVKPDVTIEERGDFNRQKAKSKTSSSTYSYNIPLQLIGHFLIPCSQSGRPFGCLLHVKIYWKCLGTDLDSHESLAHVHFMA
ncbi:mitogen-activated protein kinase kinase kinase 20-like [Populus alba]|uniref:Protein kinase domain-containing protein n=2 Tax=Populus TaxID=3689 RepID=A0A4V6ACN4_POPAL|nr:hypothetical protein NC653_040795 [Populus alba x Populus x berolinensis]TKS18086.1 hypothetical protein D5086_0000007080 [Populus alba]